MGSVLDITTPATPAAQQWQGWGTALKPAHEPIVVARKPLIGTVGANVLEHGTGALNIDGCRIGAERRYNSYAGNENIGFTAGDDRSKTGKGLYAGNKDGGSFVQGRWPANIIFDEDAGAELDAQTGVSKSGVAVRHNGVTGGTIGPPGNKEVGTPDLGYGDTGGASRFFYCAKANKSERNAGLEGFEAKRESDGVGADNPRNRTNQARANFHPTVKPLALMRYLVKLVTPPNGIVLDPFLGSGTTAVAAILEGFKWVGCEMTDEYLPIIEARVAWAKEERERETAAPELW